jgi:hypothetical protein
LQYWFLELSEKKKKRQWCCRKQFCLGDSDNDLTWNDVESRLGVFQVVPSEMYVGPCHQHELKFNISKTH